MNKKYLRFTGFLLLVFLVTFTLATSSLFAEDSNINLSNTDPSPHLYLKSRIDENLPKELTKMTYDKEEVGPYLVTFDGPIEDKMKKGVEELGVKLVEYVPHFSFLVIMTPEIAEKVKSLPFVDSTMIYQPGHKISPALKDTSGNIRLNEEVTVRIITFDNMDNSLDEEIAKVNGKKLAHSKNKTIAKVNSNHIARFARLNSVKFIEINPKHVLFNDVSVGIMDVDDVWNLGYDGTGQVVAVCDTGLDTGVNDSSMHEDFQGRIIDIFALGRVTADDPHGHGTHVSGSVLGDGTRSGGQIKGAAPNASLIMQSVLDSQGGLGGLPTDLNDLFAQAWNSGARIHTNSWGAPVNGDYNTDSQAVDEYVWNNDMIILFSAGNEGDSPSGDIKYDTIGSPGTAKNCITVGASENYRPEMPLTGWGHISDDPTEIAAFSSRGYCEDGRIKPDVVAPGTWILSTKSSVAPATNYWQDYNDYYAYMGGTSMSTPLTAGMVAIARQYMQAEWNHTPSPAMMKAAVINGAIDLGFGFPSRDQGWGRVSLIDTLVSKEYMYEDETYSLSTGSSKIFNYTVETSNDPLKVSLVWTDYPGSVTSSIALVNDLDLKITAPSGTVYYGNDFSAPFDTAFDRLNNVENVYINNPEVGTYTIEVSAYNVPQGPQPFALFSSGDFGTPSNDTIPPTCSINSPTGGTTVRDTIAFSADATDNEAISRVEFYVDDNLVGTDSTSPYSINWDTTTVANGNHTLLAKAFDIAGNIGESSPVAVDVQNQVSVTYVTDTISSSVKGGLYTEHIINVTAQGAITLNLSSSYGSDLYIELYSPSGSLQATDPSSIVYQATTIGSYIIRVNNTSTRRRALPYTLTATYPIQ